MTHAQVGHLVPGAILAAISLFIIATRPYFGGVDNMAVGLGDSERIEAAIERRKQAEGAPKPLGLWIGVSGLVVAVLIAFTSLNVVFIDALLYFCMAVGCAAVFVGLRNSQRTRVAVLAVRRPVNVIGVHWFALALFCAASLICIALAWRLTGLPAMLSGVDLPAEEIVDDALRLRRSSFILMSAMAQTTILASQIDAPAEVRLPMFCATFAVPVIFFGWYVTRGRNRFEPMLKALQ
jgi:hypothetical protein